MTGSLIMKSSRHTCLPLIHEPFLSNEYVNSPTLHSGQYRQFLAHNKITIFFTHFETQKVDFFAIFGDFSAMPNFHTILNIRAQNGAKI